MLRTFLASMLRLSSLMVILVIALVSVLIWFFGGGLTLGGVSPLEPTRVRIYTIIALFVGYFVISFLRHALARRANARLINSMLANDELVSMGNDLSSEEVELIRERFEAALKTLRDNPIDGRKKRNYLFELPWYIIIGPPGTGKTTILRNSSLDFPLAAEGQAAIQGIGGTRNCDWWITNEAVLIDTAGRYTTQDVNQGIDAAAWGGFLELLKQHRGRRPVNGILLAISIADVALAGEEERARQAETLRQRLRELHRAFSMRLPVYVLFTKCDLIAGFEEFFDEAEEAEREQVWGVTFPYDAEQMTFGPMFEAGFLDLVARIEKRLPAKLAAERNNGRRCRIYGFPHEFGSLATVLRGFVGDVFRVNRYEPQPLLRGIYFTSGTQEGTPFDRLLGAMGRSFSLAPSRQMATSGQGKAYFIKKLLTDIVFAEQNLVGKNSKVERRIAAMYMAGYAGLIALAAVLSAYWLYGLNQSLAEIAEVSDATDRLEARLTEAEQNGSMVNLLPALDASRELQQLVAQPTGWGLGGMLGVDARSDLAPPVNETYDKVLKNRLLPAIAARMQTEVQMLTNSPETNNLLLREQLQTYLMLTTGENYDGSKVRQAFQGQAEAVFPLSPDNRSRMVEHMDMLAGLLPDASAAMQPAVSAAQPTVAVARERLSEVPQADDIYKRMLSDSQDRYQLATISLVNLLGTGALRVDTGSLGGANRIPGLYTKAGFYNFFLPQLPQYVRSSMGTDWVLGGNGAGDNAYNEVAEKIVALYTKDYIAAWRGAINQVRVIDFETLNRGQNVLQELSGPQSPLTKLLDVLRENTELTLPSANAGAEAAAGQTASALPGAGGLLMSAADAVEKTAISTAFGDAPWPGTAIGNEFKPLTSLVDPQNSSGSLDKIQQLFGDMFGTVSSIATAPLPEAAAFEFVSQRAKSATQDSFATLRSEAAVKPEPVRSMVDFVVNRNWQLMMRLSYQHINALWQQEVVPVCNSILADRYPFAPGSREEVSLEDFGELFKPAGIIDNFFTTNLGPFVTVKGRQLNEMSIQNVSLGFSPEALAQFSRAQLIRDAFFGTAGTTPEAKFTIEPVFLDPKALRSSFVLDDEEIVYRHGPVRAKDFVWPSKLDASTARLEVTLLDETKQMVERDGTWSIFRMIGASGLARGRGQDQFTFSIEKEGARASFRLKAASVVNPFNMGLYSSFRCPPAL